MRSHRANDHRRRRTDVLAITLLIALVCCRQSCAQTPPAGDQTRNVISGTVVSSVTREPISRALVYSMDERDAALTDEHGHFEFSLASQPSPGTVIAQPNSIVPLRGKRPGFLDAPGPQAALQVGPGQKDVTLTLVPEALIVGRVRFPSAEAADHVQVQLYSREVRDGFAHWLPLTSTGTRSDGEFRFAGLAAGQYKLFTLESTEQDPLTADPNGPVYAFPPRYFAAARDFATADTIQVRAGETITANITPERQKYYEVRIPVARADPGGPPGLAVSVFAQGHRGPGFELGFNRSQNAIVGSLPNGSYTIEASSFGPSAATGVTNITVANGPVNGPPITLAANPSIEINIRQDFSAADNTHAQLGREDRSQPAAYVSLQSAEELPSGRRPAMPYQAQGDPPTLSGVRPGRYWVQVQAGLGYAASVTSGGRDLLRAPLVVPLGASIPPIEITLRYDTAEIDVTLDSQPSGFPGGKAAVTNAPGASITAFLPQGGSSVYCVPLANDGSLARGFNGWADGRFVLQQLPPGDYRILAFDSPQQLEYRNPAAMRAFESKGQVVHLTPGQKAEITLQPIRSE